jgi:hypothetical protein
MNLAALILTAVSALAALWTVRLAYRAIGLSRDASVSANRIGDVWQRGGGSREGNGSGGRAKS